MRISDWSSDVCSSDLLQGDMQRAEVTFTRFFINSTIGMLGLFDIAAESGFPYHEEDFGQTLGTYGAGEGFYLVLPILGPSSLRDGPGRIVDIFLDPLTSLAPREFNLGSSEDRRVGIECVITCMSRWSPCT